MQIRSELGRSAGTKDGNPFLFFHLEYSMDWEYMMVTVHVTHSVRQECSDLTHEISLERVLIYMHVCMYVCMYVLHLFLSYITNDMLKNNNNKTVNLLILFQSQTRVRILGLPVDYQLSEFRQTYVHPDDDAIQPSHPLSFPSPPDPNPSHHQRFLWVNSTREVAKILELQL